MTGENRYIFDRPVLMNIILESIPYTLKFRSPFRIAHGVRDSTAAVFVKLISGNNVAFGEATLPPYLAETMESVMAFIRKLNPEQLSVQYAVALHTYLGSIHPACKPAQAAVDMAWHDLTGKINGVSVHEMYALQGKTHAPGAFTIAINDESEMEKKIAESGSMPLLKIKTSVGNDKQLVKAVRKYSDKPVCIDANQSWKNDKQVLDLLFWLKDENVLFIEQPFNKDAMGIEKIFEKSPLPLIADESFQTIEDLTTIKNQFHGINIKLMKCGGIYPALQIIRKAKEAGLKILIGCMSESSCGCAAASHLLSLADWYDLDGPLLLSNDPFAGLNFINGEIQIPEAPGVGVELISPLPDY
jgi:L-alanine-DL-glutamate epimerase-like enolase superfamily enzyme